MLEADFTEIIREQYSKKITSTLLTPDTLHLGYETFYCNYYMTSDAEKHLLSMWHLISIVESILK